MRLDLAELMGREYIMEHCFAEIAKRSRQKAYQVYVTDALMIIAENLSRMKPGREMSMRFLDIVEGMKKDEPEEDNRTCEEIVNDIWAHGFGR